MRLLKKDEPDIKSDSSIPLSCKLHGHAKFRLHQSLYPVQIFLDFLVCHGIIYQVA